MEPWQKNRSSQLGAPSGKGSSSPKVPTAHISYDLAPHTCPELPFEAPPQSHRLAWPCSTRQETRSVDSAP